MIGRVQALGLAGWIAVAGMGGGTIAAGPPLPEVAGFAFPDARAARRVWEAKAGAEPVRAAPGGVWFTCPFQPGVDRSYWDAEVTLDLGRATSLVLEVTPVEAEACRAFSLYLKSGDGWYHWSGPIRGAGRQQLRLLRSRFEEEGQPRGWDQISGARISLWKARDASASFIVHRLASARDNILLVQASASAGSLSERTVSRQAARRISDLLEGMAIPHGATDDDGITGHGLDGVELAVLCDNPAPPPEALRALRAFLERGGRLIVFGSASAELAEWMGLQLGAYRAPSEPGQWASMVFGDPGRWGVPGRVYDAVWSLVPAYPAGPGAEIIARWAGADGREPGEPACLATPRGFWFCHVMRGEDPSGKERLLLGLLGSQVPSVWPTAARHRMQTAGRLAGDTSLPVSLRRIEAAASTANRDRVAAELARARLAHTAMARAFADGRYRDAVAESDRLDQAVQRAHGMTQRLPAGELRAIWDHDGIGLYPGDWNRTCRELSRGGINALFVNLLWAGKAHYPSAVVPASQASARYGDQADQCLRAGHAAGMSVHAWKVCWNLENAPAEFVAELRRAGRLQQDADGSAARWLCPSHPDNRRLELDAVRELVARYGVDGVQLDYMRYPSPRHCRCPSCRRAFERALGFAVHNWPQGIHAGGSLEVRWQQWRADELTRQVRDIRRAIDEVRPGVALSAAVYRSYPSCRDAIGQDWGRWLRDGLVDFVCPMTYTDDLSNFRAETEAHLRIGGTPGRIVPGIGLLTAESRLAPDQVLAQMNVCRELGTPGFVLFDLHPTLRDDLLPILELAAPENGGASAGRGDR